MALVLRCSNCGTAFESRLISASNVTPMTLIGNRESCPACGGSVDLPSGTFEVDAQGRWSRKDLAPLVERWLSGDYSRRQLKQAVQELRKRAADDLAEGRTAETSAGPVSAPEHLSAQAVREYVTILLMILQIILSRSTAPSVDAVLDQVQVEVNVELVDDSQKEKGGESTEAGEHELTPSPIADGPEADADPADDE